MVMANIFFIAVVSFCVALFEVHSYEYQPPVYTGICPQISGNDPEGEVPNIQKIYTIYNTYPDPYFKYCIYSDVTIVDGKHQIVTVLQNSTGHQVQLTSEMEKISVGKYLYTGFRPEVNETIQSNVVMMYDKNYSMSWSCFDFENGVHTESAAIYSNTTSVPDDIVEKFRKLLTDNGSQVGEFIKISHDNCS